MDYRSIIESRYNRANWQELLYDIFRQRVQFWQQPKLVPVDESMAKRALYTGKITLPDGHIIAIYEVELSDSVVIERNRAGIRNLLCTNWRGMGCAGAFMFCFRQNEAVLRFSYVSESFVFADDGSLTKESTDTKRFTYLLGEGHRSRTAIKQFEDLKKSALDLKAVTKAFSVEALSDLFFKEYKKQYEDIIEFITGKRMVKMANKWEEQVTGQPCREIMQEFSQFPDAEKAVRDYVKKLMGRLVFIQFLQKKGWMGCSAGEAWNDGDKEFVQNLFANTSNKNTFVDDVLEPLFNDINTKRNGDITSSQNVGNGIKIPYLNGGLFEKDDYDKSNFPLPAKYMKNLLDFFASYNFTIDENDPDDAEIGVDPEMLGRIFENLLEDNKDKGAFYTPKEIVQYMCRESLIAYLQTDVNDEQIKNAIRQFVTTHDASVLSEKLKDTVDQKLKDVKICDPAIGSGAFPMGMLRELYACRKAIEGIDDETAVSIKTHIIQNNIYGVDIEKGAVDIARLRFWLALIVDEKNPHALPNMDFKIMQGNSLLEQYEGVDLSGMSLNEQAKKKTKKGQAWQPTFAFDEEDALKNIQNAKKEYYLTDDHSSKMHLRGIINDNVRNYILNLKGCTPDIQQRIEKLPIPNDQFFLWHIYFKEVFDNGGFDIVIGNPPYGVSIKGDYRESVVKAIGKVPDFEIYYYFIELSKMILRNQGILSYIIPNTWLFNTFAKNYRIGMLETWNFIEVLDCSKFKIFDSATVMNSLLLLQKGEVKYNVVVYRPTDKASDFISLVNEKRSAMSKEQLLKMNQNWGLAFRLSSDRLNLVQKISSNTFTISNYFDCSQGYIPYRLSDLIKTYGEVEGTRIKKERLWHSEQQSDEFWIRELYGRDITKYNYLSTGEFVKYGPHVATYVDPRFFNQKRVVVREITNPCIIACIVEETYLNDPQLLPLIKKDSNVVFEYESLWAILNSKIATFYHFNHSPKATKGAFPKILILDLNTFPIPELKSEIMSPLQSKAKELLMTKKINPQCDTKEIEIEIDRLVYDLYGLTEDEIAIVEGAK
ncbi:MAG: TaqI-like C-terminal specificity domain-containing protein [Bacteroidales bacterium]|nr:TaqI-like C-terminal specificity domain-containing protein [Bacteroidales bacterium]